MLLTSLLIRLKVSKFRMPPNRKLARLFVITLSVNVRVPPLTMPAPVVVFPCWIVTPEMATTLPPVMLITRKAATPGSLGKSTGLTVDAWMIVRGAPAPFSVRFSSMISSEPVSV